MGLSYPDARSGRINSVDSIKSINENEANSNSLETDYTGTQLSNEILCALKIACPLIEMN